MAFLGLLLGALCAWARPPCPTVACNFANTGVCAELTKSGILLNSNPPRAGHQCRFYDIFPRYWGINYTEGYVYDTPVESPRIHSDIGIQCPPRGAKADLWNDTDKSNLTAVWDMRVPKRCSVRRNCLQLNKDYGNCVCGLDGLFYCLPNPNSSAFQYFWDECDKNDNYARFEVLQSWHYASVYWVLNATLPRAECAAQVYEAKAMRLDDAAALALVVLSLAL